MIQFYTSHCPKCKVLSMLMNKKNIPYESIDDESIYLEMAEKNGIMSMPFAIIDEKIFNTNELQKYINDWKE